jgi:CubicO group peptidase (beta-lactamase class C family)
MGCDVSPAVAALENLVADSIYATAAQLYVEQDGRVLVDVAVGDTCGVPVEVSTLHSAYCATKPLLPLAVAHLIDQERLDVTASIADLLTHSAGMEQPTAALWRMTPRGRRGQLLPTAAPARTAAYSEIAAWLALMAVVEAAVGEPADRFVEQTILEPIGLLDDIIIRPERGLEAVASGRIHVPVAGLPVEAIPLLSERLPQQLDDISLAFGGLISATGLGRLYTAIRSALAGERVSGMPSQAALTELLSHRRGKEWDATLRKQCAFAGGFMVDLDEHGITSCLPGAIGHASGIVPAFGLCDGRHRLTIACYLNGVSLSSADLEAARRVIVAAALAEIGL